MNNLIVIYSCLAVLWRIAHGNECTSAINIGSEYRSVSFKTPLTFAEFCDDNSVIDGTSWYRFSARTGGNIPEGTPIANSNSCPVDVYHCGSSGVIYINGKHPTDDTIATVDVCANYGVKGDCCPWTEKIKVKRCNSTNGEFFVYQLKSVPGCPIAYCAGSGIGCPTGEIYDYTTNNCVADVPPAMLKPVLSDPSEPLNPLTDSFKFNCTIQTTETSAAARFDVEWIVNGITNYIIRKTEHTVDRLTAQLEERLLIGYLGNDLWCRVTSRFTNGKTKKVLTSDPYWIGIRAPQKILTRERASNITIKLNSTIPITCGDSLHIGNSLGCSVKAYLSTPNNKLATNFGPDACFVTFTSSGRNQEVTMTVIGNPATSKNPLISYLSLEFLQTTSFKSYGVWSGYKVQDIQIQIKDSDLPSMCISSGDPHYYTFDNYKYDLFSVGQFLLVKSDLDSSLEIQTRLQRCNRNVHGDISCNCAVAVREGNTVIGVDNCMGNMGTFVEYSGERSNGTLLRKGKNIEIHTPSGVKVTVSPFHKFMNIDVELPTRYLFHTEGLCGNNNGDKSDDLTIRGTQRVDTHSNSYPRIPYNFTESYRIPNGDSFFDKNGIIKKLCNDDKITVRHCTCQSKQIECNFEDQEAEYEYTLPCSTITSTQPGKRKRSIELQPLHKRSIDSNYDDKITDINNIFNYPFDNNPQPKTNYQATWPTASGITEIQAEENCNAVVQSISVFSQCKELVDITELLFGCIQDIKYTDSLAASDGVAETLQTQCKFSVTASVVQGSQNQTAQEEILATVINNLCPNQCSGEGVCEKTVCVCNQDYIGDDCSIQKGVAPTMVAIETALCDMQKRPCQSLKVTANPMTDLLNLKCKIRHIKISNDGLTQTLGTSVIMPGKLISYTKVRCSLPPSPVSPTYTGGDFHSEHGMYISVSNDGINYSTEKFFVIYDSFCRNCNEAGKCSLKPNSCVLDGQCYDSNDCTACTSYRDIGDPKRSTAYESKDNEPLKCDDGLQQGQWFRFNQYTGGVMPNTCVRANKCGTNAPVWMKSSQSGQRSIYEAEVCSNMGNDSNDCCAWKEKVLVRECQDSGSKYHVYKLPPVPQCNMSYCSGNIKPCGYGQNWDESLSRCMSICIKGQGYNKATNFCETCAKGTYKDTYDFECKECSSGFTTESSGSTSILDCFISICPAGQHLEGSICQKCEDGYYQDGTGMSSCKACGNDLTTVTTNGTGATSISQCYNTDECSQGKDTCQSITPGGLCIDLPKWQYSCVCKAGWIGIYPNCQMECPPGKIYNKGTNSCKLCQKGTYKSSGQHSCNTCSSGVTTVTTGSTQATDCNTALCGPGHYATGLTCMPCEDGTYQPASGSMKCIDCGTDLDTVTTNGVGAKNITKCQETNECELNTLSCPSASYCIDQPKWGFKCEANCSAGMYNTVGSKACKECGKGTYKSLSDTLCRNCSSNSTTVSTGSTTVADCSISVCPKGHYASGSKCIACADGFYQDEIAAMKCKACALNLNTVSTNRTGATSLSQCLNTDECSSNKHTCSSVKGEVCVDLPKWNFTCECQLGWTGLYPDCKAPFNPWSQWSTCSVTCGPGYKVRRRTCSSTTVSCSGSTTDYSFCRLHNCTGVPNTQLTLLKVAKDDLKNIIENKNILEDALKSTTSAYCNNNRDKCCSSLGYTKARPTSISSSTWVDISEVAVYDVSYSKLSLSVKMQLSVAASNRLCEGKRTKRSTTLVLTIPGYIIEFSILANKTVVEQLIGVVILAIESSYTTLTTTTLSTTPGISSSEATSSTMLGNDNNTGGGSMLGIIIGVCCGLAVLIVIGVVIGILVSKNKNRPKEDKTAGNAYQQNLFISRENTATSLKSEKSTIDYNIFLTTTDENEYSKLDTVTGDGVSGQLEKRALQVGFKQK